MHSMGEFQSVSYSEFSANHFTKKKKNDNKKKSSETDDEVFQNVQ